MSIIYNMSRNVVDNQESILETIATNTANIKISTDSVNLNVDTLEALVGTTNTSFATLLGHTNDIENLQNQCVVLLDPIKVSNDNQLTKLTQIDTAIDTIDTVLDASLVKQTAMTTSFTTLLGHTNDIENLQNQCVVLLTTIDGVLDTQVGQLTGIDNVLDNTLVKITAGEVHLGNIETKMETNNTLIATIDGVLDTQVGQLTAIDNVLDNSLTKLGEIETTNNANQVLLGTIDEDTNNIKGLLTTLDGVQDNALTKLTEIDTALDTIDSVLDASLVKHTNNETLITAMSAKLPASLGAKANASSLATCRSTTQGAYDLSGRTTIGTASTTTKLLCDSDGHLKVDIVSGGGGDLSGVSTHAKQDTIIGHIDGLETLVGATNTLLGTLDGVQDSALTKLGEIETTNNANQVLLGTIDSDTDAIKTLLTGIDVDTNALKIDIAAIEVLHTATNSKIDTFDAVLDASLVKQTNLETLITTIDGVLDSIKVDTEAIETAVELVATGYTKIATQLTFGSGNLIANGTPETSANSVELKNNASDYIQVFLEGQNANWQAHLQFSYNNSTWFDDNTLNQLGSQNVYQNTFKKGKYVRIKITNQHGTSGTTNSFVVHIVQ